MRRIIYLNPFSQINITGGVKTAYRQVEILCELGYDASIWQPAGAVPWLETSAPVLQHLSPDDVGADDVLVFPEVLHIEAFQPFLNLRNGCMKLLFCQSRSYVFNKFVPQRDYASLGFTSVFCPSVATRHFLEQVLHVRDVTVIPCSVDMSLFRPLPKKLQIFALASKIPDKAMFIAQCLRAKYPDARDVPIMLVKDKSEKEIAHLMGESAIVLALGHREAFGLVPIEAMAAQCLVAGFHGYGGLEYANSDNGLWFWADQEEAVADALHRLICGLRNGEVWTRALISGGRAVAERYSRERTRAALLAYYTRLGVIPGMGPAVAI